MFEMWQHEHVKYCTQGAFPFPEHVTSTCQLIDLFTQLEITKLLNEKRNKDILTCENIILWKSELINFIAIVVFYNVWLYCSMPDTILVSRDCGTCKKNDMKYIKFRSIKIVSTPICNNFGI